jgi:DNA-binding CsgD family transcriptional regulator
MTDRTTTIRAIDAVKCIRDGMDDAEIMDLFQISAEGLRNLYNQLIKGGLIKRSELYGRKFKTHNSVIVEADNAALPITPVKKPVIDAAEALRCIRNGLSDADLMKKYNLSSRGVRSLLKKLVGAGAITEAEIEERDSESSSDVVVDEDVTAKVGVNLAELSEKIRSGASVTQIISLYGISQNDLEALLDKLLNDGLISRPELSKKLPPSRNLEIKNRNTGAVIHKGAAATVSELVVNAIREGIDLSEAALAGIDLARAELSGARLARADLTGAYLVGADLTGANLAESSLKSSNLFGAILHKTNLAGADLSDSNLSMVYGAWAFMPDVNLSESNVTHATFSGANMARANFFETIVNGTNLNGAYLEGASLDSARKVDPATGFYMAWKGKDD